MLVTRKCAGPESGTCTSCGYCDAACLSLLGCSAYVPHGSSSESLTAGMALMCQLGNQPEVPALLSFDEAGIFIFGSYGVDGAAVLTEEGSRPSEKVRISSPSPGMNY